MIKNKEEALEHCKKFDVDLKNYKKVAVSESGNIYVNTSNFDPNDSDVKFYLKGFPIEVLAVKESNDSGPPEEMEKETPEESNDSENRPKGRKNKL